MPAGFVLTGGESRRMGRDKALLPWRGVPLVAWVARQVEAAARSVALLGPPERYAGLGWECLPDLHPGNGPLGGIHAALASGRSRRNLIVAVDMPSVTSESLLLLLAAADDLPECQAVIPVHDGLREPLCGVYDASALPAIESALADKRLKMQDLLENLRCGWLEMPAGFFENVNTPEEWLEGAR